MDDTQTVGTGHKQDPRHDPLYITYHGGKSDGKTGKIWDPITMAVPGQFEAVLRGERYLYVGFGRFRYQEPVEEAI